MMGVAKTSWQHGQLFSVLAGNSGHCHPTDGVFDTTILLSHVIYPSLFVDMALIVTKKIASEIIDYIIICAVSHP